MKKIFLILLPILLAGCSNELIQPDATVITENRPKAEGMQRVKVYSRDQLRSLVECLDENKVLSRSDYGESLFTENEELFVSLAEANKQKVYSQLTAAQLREIENDPDGLEFEPSDEIIADMRFAQLLNADREIQIGDTVYRYITKGIVYTTVEHAADLKKAELLTFNLDPRTPSRGPDGGIQISDNMTFFPMDYSIQTYDDHDPWGPKGDDDEDRDTSEDGDGSEGPGDGGGGSGNWTPSTESRSETICSLKLPNGTVIPTDEIRFIDYDKNDDGTWTHKLFTEGLGFFGKNILVVKNFSKDRRRLAMNFYDQNYKIYAHIGTKLKMQKQVCGIWWNIKADEMIQGWEVVTIQHVLKNIYKPFNPETNKNEHPLFVQDTNFPIKNQNRIFLHVPLVNYDITGKDINKTFRLGLVEAFKVAEKYLTTNDKKTAGLYTGYDNVYYFSRAPYSETYKNVRSVDVKFYKEIKPFLFSFSYNFVTGFGFKPIDFPENEKVSLHSGSVYGAIKYNGEWKAAKIIKYPPQN
ncbi:MAG: hypothetical protein K2I94_01200 [Muribaculaceae bacterium]|nr:hypothetical protein [Muribaculaceae bacterium]